MVDVLRRPRHPALRLAYKIAIGLVGAGITVVGLVLVPLPGPGWLIVFAGLAVLSTEFAWAARLLAFARRKVAVGTEWLRQRSVALKASLTAAILVAVGAGLWLVDLMVGLPGWVPLL